METDDCIGGALTTQSLWLASAKEILYLGPTSSEGPRYRRALQKVLKHSAGEKGRGTFVKLDPIKHCFPCSSLDLDRREILYASTSMVPAF